MSYKLTLDAIKAGQDGILITGIPELAADVTYLKDPASGLYWQVRSGVSAPGVQAAENEGVKNTYSAGALGIAPGLTPTDFLIIQGSASKTRRVKRIELAGVATTAGTFPVQLVRRSTADVGGTPVPATQMAHDTNDAAAGGSVNHYTAAPGLSAPAAPTLSQVASGTLAATSYFAKATWVAAAGETLPSAESTLAVAINNVLFIAAPASPPAGATGWNAYVSTTTGTETKQNATPIALGTGWQEPNTGLIAGAALPGANTTGPGVLVGILRAGRLFLPVAGTLGSPLVWDFATRSTKAVVLRGVSDFLCVNFNGAATPAGAAVDYDIEYTDE